MNRFPKGVSEKFCCSHRGYFVRSVGHDYDPLTGEILFDHFPSKQEIDKSFPNYLSEKTENDNNAIILNELANSDLKIIRALCEGDTDRIANHVAEQSAKRASLILDKPKNG